MRIRVEPFDERAFKAFGRAVLHPGGPERHDISDAFTNLPASTAKAWVNNPQPVTLPLTLRKIERHPHSAQTFIPIGNASYVAIACLSDGDGAPLPETLRAFRVDAPVGVQYRQGVWHHGMILLEKRANFVVLMSFNGLPPTNSGRFPTLSRYSMLDHDDAAHLNRDFLGYGKNPPDADWPGGARLALNVCVNIEEGSEPSFSDGDGRSEGGLTESRASEFTGRDLATESMFEYGSRVGFWRILRILRILRKYEVPATMFACALALERNAAIREEIREGPYDICAHGWRWEHHVGVPEAAERERIARAAKSITASVGRAPQGWYCRYGPSVNTRRLLVEHGGFLYDSDAYNDELPYWRKFGGTDHLVVPYSLVCNDAGFLRGTIASADAYFSLLRDTFDMLYREGAKRSGMMSVGLHLRVVGHPARAVGLERFLDHVRKHPDVWLCRRADIAKHWRERHPPKAS